MNIRLRAWDLLRALLFPAQPARATGDASALLQGALVQTELLRQANASYVTAALWKALCRSRLKDALADEVREYLDAFYVMNAERNERIRRQILECVGALNRAGVSAMPLKGASYLLGDLYDDPGERFLSDSDLLVPVAEAREASSALAGIGFRPAPSRFDYSEHHHMPPLVRTLNDAAVELHTAPVLPVAQRALSTDEIWSAASERKSHGCRWFVATATDTAMLSFLHGQVVDRGLARCIVDFRSFQDLRHLIERSDDPIDWQRNIDRASRGGVLPAFRRYAFVFDRLTSCEATQAVGPRWPDRAHYALCRAAVRWPSIQDWARDLELLTSRRLMNRYTIGDSLVILNAYRLRALGGLIRKRVRRLTVMARGRSG
jgi:hypothetical protein